MPEPTPPGLPPLNEALSPEDEAYAEGFARELTLLLDHWHTRSAEIEESFVAPKTTAGSQREALRRFAHLCLRFADLEQRIEGTIACEIPTHFAVVRDEHELIRPEQGEHLARAERERLELPDGPIENLGDLLDERGIKIVQWDNAGDECSGAFLFDEDTGPALLALAPPSSRAGRFLLAHAYGHLLADIDPYENRFCHHGSPLEPGPLRPGGRPADSPVPDYATEEWERLEARADRFARALLLPAANFTNNLEMFGEGGARGFRLQRLGEIAFYYGVETAVVLQRLADLDLAPPDRIAALAAELGSTSEAAPPRVDRTEPGAEPPPAGAAMFNEPGIPSRLPTRFVHLSLALFVKRLASRSQLVRLLNLDRRTVDRLVGLLDLPAAFREWNGE